MSRCEEARGGEQEGEGKEESARERKKRRREWKRWSDRWAPSDRSIRAGLRGDLGRGLSDKGMTKGQLGQRTLQVEGEASANVLQWEGV